MALTADQVAYFETKLGTPLNQVDLEARLARLGSEPAVALEVLRTRLATWLATPIKFAVPGEYSEDKADNIAATQKAVDELEGEAGDPSGMLVSGTVPAPRWGRGGTYGPLDVERFPCR